MLNTYLAPWMYFQTCCHIYTPMMRSALFVHLQNLLSTMKTRTYHCSWPRLQPSCWSFLTLRLKQRTTNSLYHWQLQHHLICITALDTYLLQTLCGTTFRTLCITLCWDVLENLLYTGRVHNKRRAGLGAKNQTCLVINNFHSLISCIVWTLCMWLTLRMSPHSLSC